ncbi:MAG: HepT-like ribonuclease domain-containing protein [Candidatus Hydrogenedentota bacterium]
MTRHDDKVRLRHMLDHAQEAVSMVEGKTQADLVDNRVLQFALTRVVEIVGEAATRVSPETQQQLKRIPWPQVIALRNRLAHGYEAVDLYILWEIVEMDMPALIRALQEALALDQ